MEKLIKVTDSVEELPTHGITNDETHEIDERVSEATNLLVGSTFDPENPSKEWYQELNKVPEDIKNNPIVQECAMFVFEGLLSNLSNYCMSYAKGIADMFNFSEESIKQLATHALAKELVTSQYYGITSDNITSGDTPLKDNFGVTDSDLATEDMQNYIKNTLIQGLQDYEFLDDPSQQYGVIPVTTENIRKIFPNPNEIISSPEVHKLAIKAVIKILNSLKHNAKEEAERIIEEFNITKTEVEELLSTLAEDIIQSKILYDADVMLSLFPDVHSAKIEKAREKTLVDLVVSGSIKEALGFMESCSFSDDLIKSTSFKNALITGIVKYVSGNAEDPKYRFLEKDIVKTLDKIGLSPDFIQSSEVQIEARQEINNLLVEARDRFRSDASSKYEKALRIKRIFNLPDEIEVTEDAFIEDERS